MSTKSWDQDLVAGIAAEIKRLRTVEKLSVQKLADLTEAAGHAVPRTTIADMELGRRKYISVTELLVLAAALNTPPIALLFPPPYPGDVEVLPGLDATAVQAAKWFSGESDPAFIGDTDRRKAFRTNAERLRIEYRIWDLENELNALYSDLEGMPSDTPASTRELLESLIIKTQLHIRELTEAADET